MFACPIYQKIQVKVRISCIIDIETSFLLNVLGILREHTHTHMKLENKSKTCEKIWKRNMKSF